MEKTAEIQPKTVIGRPFKPGQSGNPKGRPKKSEQEKQITKATKGLIEDYKRALAEALPQISPALIAQALSGNILAIKEINDRVMGKPKESLDITSGGIPLWKPTEEERIKAEKALEDLDN